LRFQALGGGGEGEGVGDFEGGGEETGAEDGMERAHGVAHGGKSDRQAGAIGRERQQLEGRLGDDAEKSFGADEEPVEVEAGFVFVSSATEADDGAIGEDDFEAEDVIACDAVFEAARAAGVGDDVAANGAFTEAGGVGRIEQAALLDCILEGLGFDARLDDSDEIGRVDFFDAVEAGEGKDDTAASRDAAADVAVAGTARGDRDFVAMRKTEKDGD